jgi:hypothetical protein
VLKKTSKSQISKIVMSRFVGMNIILPMNTIKAENDVIYKFLIAVGASMP